MAYWDRHESGDPTVSHWVVGVGVDYGIYVISRWRTFLRAAVCPCRKPITRALALHRKRYLSVVSGHRLLLYYLGLSIKFSRRIGSCMHDLLFPASKHDRRACLRCLALRPCPDQPGEMVDKPAEQTDPLSRRGIIRMHRLTASRKRQKCAIQVSKIRLISAFHISWVINKR